MKKKKEELQINETPDQSAPAPKSVLEILNECGRLKTPIGGTLTVICWAFPDVGRKEFEAKLSTEHTPEYNAYREGLALGDHDIQMAMHKGAASGDADALDALNNMEKKKAVDRAIQENFFPEVDE